MVRSLLAHRKLHALAPMTDFYDILVYCNQKIDTEADVLNTTFTDLVPGQLYDVKVVGTVLDKGGIFTASATTSGRTCK